MSITKKLLLSAVAVYAISGAAAFAGDLNVDLNLGGVPAYIAPAPVYIAPSPAYVQAPWVEGYDPHHRRHDQRYWHDHGHWDHGHDPHDPHWHH